MNRFLTALFTGFMMMAVQNASAATYTVDPSHTRVLYHVKHLGFSNFYGHFNNVTGTINFDPEHPEKGSVDISIDAKSVSMDNTILDQKLKGKEYFNTDKFPVITFKSTSVDKDGADTGTVDGDLTMMGVTRPVTLDVKFNTKGFNQYSRTMMVGFSARTKIRRSDFGLKATLPAVSDEVSIIIEVEGADKSGKTQIVPAAK